MYMWGQGSIFARNRLIRQSRVVPPWVLTSYLHIADYVTQKAAVTCQALLMAKE